MIIRLKMYMKKKNKKEKNKSELRSCVKVQVDVLGSRP